MKYSNILDYVPQVDSGFLKGSWRCFGAGIDMIGIIGILLLLGGVVQIGAGAYFMVVLPIFDSASNIWTGAVTGFVGSVYMYYGCTNQSERKHYATLSLSLLALLTNVANLVIIVIGERGIFLSEEDKLLIDRESKNNLYRIAIWGTATTSCTILLILFMVAQFIFCGYLTTDSSKNKNQPASRFHNPKKERFFPPSRVINSKHSSYLIPTLDDMMNPHISPTSAWVYNGEDKLHGGFYPMGFESHPNSLESGRRPTARHSSFATTPRYARVLHRPQRAQSFASNRDPFSLHGVSYSTAPTHQHKLISQVKRYPYNHIRRSVSMNSYQGATATLSKKYQGFSNMHTEAAVIEVGSLISEISEHSLADALIDCQPPVKMEKSQKHNEKFLSEKDSNRETFSKGSSNKGPAPQPPKLRPSIPKELHVKKQSSMDNIKIKDNSGGENVKMDEMSKEFCECKSDEEEIICNERVERLEIDESKSYENHKRLQLDETDKRMLSLDKSRPDLRHDNQKIIEKQKIANHDEFIIALKSYLTNSTFSDKSSWDKLEHVLMEILNQNIEKKKELIEQTQNKRIMIRQTQERVNSAAGNFDSTMETRTTPHPGIQNNKIVLRVPSFKNTSCQTEYYRPVRKKSSPTHLPKISPSMPLWKNDMDVQVNTLSSSSSGYSSPEAESKDSSPVNSGPPSPSSTTSGVCEGGTNVTIIEINRSDIVNQDILNQTFNSVTPPKPYRMRNMASYNLPNIHNNFSQMEPTNLPFEKTNSTQTKDLQRENMLLAEAVNPILVPPMESSKYVPRVIDVVHKTRVSRHETFAEMGRQRSPNTRTNSLSLPRVSYAHPNRPRLNRSESRSPSPPKQISKLGPYPGLDKPQSTAAYLASLELLASHYRQQALANAKQLQMQRTMLEQRRKYESTKNSPDTESAWQPQTIDHT